MGCSFYSKGGAEHSAKKASTNGGRRPPVPVSPRVVPFQAAINVGNGPQLYWTCSTTRLVAAQVSAKYCVFCRFTAEVVLKLKFPNNSIIRGVNFLSMFPPEYPVINIWKNIVSLFKLGKPFSADVITSQGLVYGSEISERVFYTAAGITGRLLFIQHF